MDGKGNTIKYIHPQFVMCQKNTKKQIILHACSVTTQLRQLTVDYYNKVRCGAGGNRTPDPLLAKQVL